MPDLPTRRSTSALHFVRLLKPLRLMLVAVAPMVLPAQRRLEAKQDLVISAEKFNLTGIGSVHVSPKGVIALPQFKDGRIAFFGATGELLGFFGRRGEGPGELRGISGFSSWKADTLVASDASNNRITLIGPDLKLVRMMPRPLTLKPATGTGELWSRSVIDLGMRSDNSLMVLISTTVANPAPAWLGVPPGASALVNVTLDGTVRRTTAIIPRIEDPPECTASIDRGRNPDGQMRTMTTAIPLCPRAMGDSPNGKAGVLILRLEPDAKGAGYRIVRIGSDRGDTIVNRRFTYTPIPIPGRVIDSVRTSMAARASNPPAVKAYFQAMQMSKVYPPVALLKLGDDGSIWLQEYGPSLQSQQWRVLDAKGALVGVVTLPAAVTLKVVLRDAVWGVVEDSDGFQNLVRYRIQ